LWGITRGWGVENKYIGVRNVCPAKESKSSQTLKETQGQRTHFTNYLFLRVQFKPDIDVKDNPQIPLSKAFSGICIITVKFCPLVPKYQENDDLYFFLLHGQVKIYRVG
jgi:hypothetical protein